MLRKVIASFLLVSAIAFSGFAQDKPVEDKKVESKDVKLDSEAVLKFQNFDLKAANIKLQYNALKAQFDTQFAQSKQVQDLQKELTKVADEAQEASKSELKKLNLDETKFRINSDKGVVEEIPAPPVSADKK